MICPRCGKEVSDTETICPFCYQEINRDVEFNDYKEDGFVQVKTKDGANYADSVSFSSKRFNISHLNIFVISIVFILGVAVFTLFSLKFVQSNDSIIEPTEYVTEYVTETPAPTEAPTEPTTVKNTLKSYSVENIYGSWRMENTVEQEGVAIPYYTFYSDGVAQENYGSVVYGGLFRDESTDAKHSVFITIEGNLDGMFEFEVTGNSKDGYTLTLTSRSGATYTLVQVKEAKSYSLSAIENYEINEDLIGLWASEDGDKDYQFNKDGTLVRNTGYTTMNAVWTIDNQDQITVKYMRNQVTTLQLRYKISADKKRIKINNVIYYKQ